MAAEPLHGSDGPLTSFEARARVLLQESIDNLDGRTRSQLTQARHAALAQLATGDTAGRFGARHWLLPAGGMAAVALAVMLWFGPAREASQETPTVAVSTVVTHSPIEDLEIIATAESLELIEDLDFYAWLDSESALPAAGSEAG